MDYIKCNKYTIFLTYIWAFTDLKWICILRAMPFRSLFTIWQHVVSSGLF